MDTSVAIGAAVSMKRVIRYGGLALVAVGAALWTGGAQAQLLALSLDPTLQSLTTSSEPNVLQRNAPSQNQPAAAPADVTTDVPARLHRQQVYYATTEAPGTIVVDTPNTYLYFVLGGGKAIRYGIGVGRDGFTWSGAKTIERKSEWPDWLPPAEMIQRQPYLPRFMAGGPGNPLGARAMYLSGTVYRIHGTNKPSSIGQHVSSGCIRMLNEDVIDLYSRTPIGTRVVVLPMDHTRVAVANLQSRPATRRREEIFAPSLH
jgi:lipoprotein-anchoring transpeptidase ErfK/SrfK